MFPYFPVLEYAEKKAKMCGDPRRTRAWFRF